MSGSVVGVNVVMFVLAYWHMAWAHLWHCCWFDSSSFFYLHNLLAFLCVFWY